LDRRHADNKINKIRAAYRYKIGNKGFKAIAGAPFARNLTWLGVRATNITTNGVQANIAALNKLNINVEQSVIKICMLFC